MSFIQNARRNVLNSYSHIRRGLYEDVRGNAAIEFALIAPILAVILAGSADLGLLIFSRFQLEAAISDSASYAMVHADQVDGTSSGDLAAKVAAIIAGEDTSGATQASIVVNNGGKADYDGMKINLGGQTSQADACYCPTGNAWSLHWGSRQSCSSSCPDGGISGKYVAITAKQPYTPMFVGYGLVKDGFIHASAVVQTK